MPFHREKFEHLIKELAMEFLAREINRTSLVTVTGLRVENKEQDVTILYTVLPIDQEKPVFDFLMRKRAEFREFVKSKARLRAIPTFDFAIDRGEKNRQKMDEIV